MFTAHGTRLAYKMAWDYARMQEKIEAERRHLSYMCALGDVTDEEYDEYDSAISKLCTERDERFINMHINKFVAIAQKQLAERNAYNWRKDIRPFRYLYEQNRRKWMRE